MLRLLQRQSLASEIVRDLGPVADPKEWSKTRTGDVRPLYADIATRAKAGRLRDVRARPRTTQAKNPPADEVSAAKVLHSDFKPLAGFLKQLLGLVP